MVGKWSDGWYCYYFAVYWCEDWWCDGYNCWVVGEFVGFWFGIIVGLNFELGIDWCDES